MYMNRDYSNISPGYEVFTNTNAPDYEIIWEGGNSTFYVYLLGKLIDSFSAISKDALSAKKIANHCFSEIYMELLNG